jgi:hypothetical protein
VLLHFFKRLPAAFWLVIWIVFAAFLWFALYPYQLNRGCWIGEWPFELGCNADRPTGYLATEPENVYSTHLRSNPGDSLVYTWLALHRWKSSDVDSQKSIEAALKVSPLDAQILTAHANNSLNNKNWHEAAVSLIKLVEIGSADAGEPLLYLLTTEASRSTALNLITKESVWLDRLLKNANPKVAIDSLQPVFNHGRSLGLLSAETTINVIDKLQAAGRWLEAYSLWVTYQGTLKEGLFNAGFDSKVSQKAFDWKWALANGIQKSMIVRQISAHPKSGMLLELELVGRSAIPLPMVRQNVILFGENYVFRGRYLTDRLQINEGLSWKFSCASGGEPWAQTDALQDTQKQWRTFELKLKVPATCGAAILVGLETKSRGEARVGISGLVQFDELSITSENQL